MAWSALKLFRGLDIAFSEVYDASADPSLAEQVRDGVVVALASGAAVALLVVTGAAFAAPSVVGVPLGKIVGPAALVVGLTVAFLPVFYVFPPVEMTVRKALPGAAFTAVGWAVLQVLFGLYAARADRYAAYGILGAVLLFVTWLYVAGIVVLLGAALNAVRAGDTGPEGTTGAASQRAATARDPL